MLACEKKTSLATDPLKHYGLPKYRGLPGACRMKSTYLTSSSGMLACCIKENCIAGHATKGNSTGSPVECDSSAEGTLANRANQARLRKAHILSSRPLW
uniref:Uncharacterized protein n=1 Tax=Parascaris equorum TaxID=6256 RepID=A0A914R3P6_PAREQ